MALTESQFRSWCTRIGLDDTTGLASFDYNHPAAQWLVENISENNIVSRDDLSRHEEVITLGLDEPALDDLQSNLETTKRIEQQLAELESEIQDLTTEAYHLQDVNKMLQGQQDTQSSHQRVLQTVHTQHQFVRQEEKRRAAEADQSLRQQLAQLMEDVSEIARLVSEHPASWLLQLAVADDIDFNEAITAFLSTASNHINNTPRSPLLPSTPPKAKTLTRGSDPTSNIPPEVNMSLTESAPGSNSVFSVEEGLAELDRLRWMYPISKQQRLSACCKAAESVASLELMQSLLNPNNMQMSPDPTRLRSLRQEALSLQIAIKELEGERGFKQLWSEMQHIWDAPLHVAQYQRQLEGAQQLLETRRAKVDVMIAVAACLEMVAAVSDAETEQLKKAYAVMQSVDRAASSFSEASQHRAARYTASKAPLLQSTRTTLHQEDVTMHRLHQGLHHSAMPPLTAIQQCCKMFQPTPSSASTTSPTATQVLKLLAASTAGQTSGQQHDLSSTTATGGRSSLIGPVTVSSVVKLITDIREGRDDFQAFINDYIFKDSPKNTTLLHEAVERLRALVFPSGDTSSPELTTSEVQSGISRLHAVSEQLVDEINSLVAASQKLRAPEETWEGLSVELQVLGRFFTHPEQLHELLRNVKMRNTGKRR